MIFSRQSNFSVKYVTEFSHETHFIERLNERFPEFVGKVHLNFNNLINGATVILNRPVTINTLLKDYGDESLYLYHKKYDMVIVMEKTKYHYLYITKTVYRASESKWVINWLEDNLKIARVPWVAYRSKLGA